MEKLFAVKGEQEDLSVQQGMCFPSQTSLTVQEAS